MNTQPYDIEETWTLIFDGETGLFRNETGAHGEMDDYEIKAYLGKEKPPEDTEACYRFRRDGGMNLNIPSYVWLKKDDNKKRKVVVTKW